VKLVVGQRVKVMPWTDLFMMGETHGKVVKVGRKWVTIEGERSGRKFSFLLASDNLEIEP
jgi:hypothetical protein